MIVLLRWCVRCMRTAGRLIYPGLVHVGAAMTGTVVPPGAIPRPARPALAPPPPRHPERLAPDNPMTDQERLIWSQLR